LVRKYCPELSKFNKKYISEPWKAPTPDQKKGGCRVTGDGSKSEDTENGERQVYTKPMFDFDERR
jgi:cryptochrome